MDNTTTNDTSPGDALPTLPRVNYPFSVGTPWLRPRVDEHPFVGPSMSQPPRLLTPPFQPQFNDYPLCCITNDNSPNALSEELEHAPQINGASRGSQIHEIHVVLLHYFCDSRERDLRFLCNDMQKAHMYGSKSH